MVITDERLLISDVNWFAASPIVAATAFLRGVT
jgi:hypothetical protein